MGGPCPACGSPSGAEITHACNPVLYQRVEIAAPNGVEAERDSLRTQLAELEATGDALERAAEFPSVWDVIRPDLVEARDAWRRARGLE